MFFGRTPGQGSKSAKFAVLPPGHAGFPKRAERSEGSDTTPVRNAPCFAVQALVCDPLSEAECVLAFVCESERGPFVREVEKRDEKRLVDSIYGGNFAGVFPSADIVGFTENREMYVYKSVAEQKGFRWQHKTVLWPGEGRLLFRRVSRCVPSFSERRVCTHVRS